MENSRKGRCRSQIVLQVSSLLCFQCTPGAREEAGKSFSSYSLLPAELQSRLLTVLCGTAPFEEDDRDPNIWFLDHSYVDSMAGMFKKVNGKH